MKLRQKSKRDQALDAAASVAKTWSEWRLGEKVAKTATKASKKATKSAAKAAKKAKKSDAGKRKPVRILGIVALLGGIGAAIAKKLGGGKAEPLYTPPGPAADMAPPPPSPVAVGDLVDTPAVNEPLGDEKPAAADQPPSEDLAPEPEDLVSDTADPAVAADDDEPTEKPA